MASFLLVLLIAAGGCNRNSNAKAATRVSTASAQWSDDLFNFAIANLNHLEDNDCQEMMRTTQERLDELRQLPPGTVPPNAMLASWPEPDMLRQVVGRLNQWTDTLAPQKPWTPDPMLATMPKEIAALPMVAEKELAQQHFTSLDGYMLMEAVWARDAARWAKGSANDDLLVARNLFDWTVRNIQLDYDGPDHMPQVPWETLFFGHGTAMERAWTYILLLRQCDIDAALLALPGNESTESTTVTSDAKVKPWCVAVLLGDKEKKLYLFEPRLGLPVPTAKGLVADKSGQLDVQPATLDQVVADPKLLDRLALGKDEPYWAKKLDLKKAMALIEASPLYMEPRAKRVEATLAGDRKLVLNAEPSQQAARFKAVGISDVRLWHLPFTTYQRRLGMKSEAVFSRLANYFCFIGFGSGSLYKGRVLHLKGRFFDEKGAIAYYQRARPRARDVRADEQKRAQACYKSLVDQANSTGHKVTPDLDERFKQFATMMVQMEINAIMQGKIDAGYWLGLVEYEQQQYESALDYFTIRTLQAGHDILWAAGANYNIGRCNEKTGQWKDAVQEYESSIYLRNEAGNLLRAKWLREIHGAKEAAAETKTVEKKIGERKIEDKKADEAKKDEPKKADDSKSEKKSADKR